MKNGKHEKSRGVDELEIIHNLVWKMSLVPMTTAYLALGSNLGDRLKHLQFALAELESMGVNVVARSPIYATQSVESGGEGEFLNAAARVETELSAPELLKVCQQIEAKAGRQTPLPGEHRAGPRALDLDILLFGDQTYDAPELEIPHPRALGRTFVLRPLLDVLEGARVEVWGEF